MTKLQLVLEAIDRASGPIRGVDRAIDKLQKTGSRAMQAIGKAAKLAAVGGIAALTAAITAAGRTAIKFQDLWSDANKTLGMSGAGMDAFQGAVNDLSARIPIARDQIVEMTGAAGRLGIKGREELTGFVELSAKAAKAFDVGPTRMAEIFGNLRETMGYNTQQLEAWADKVNWLGNNTAASEADIANYASAVQGIAKEAGLAEDATLALGTAMIAAGRAPEVAATGLRAFLRTMSKGWDDLSKAQKGGVAKFWDNLTPPAAMDKAAEFQDKIQKMMLTDAEGAIRLVSEKISTLPDHLRGAFVNQYFGEEAARALGPLLSNAELLEKALGRISEFSGGKVAGALTEEFLGATDDVLDNWQKLKNALSVRSEKAGIPLLDTINDGLKGTIELLTTMDERATVFDRIGASFSGFMKGFDGSGIETLSASLDTLWESASRFLFGEADGEASANRLGRMFNDAQEAGTRFREMIDGFGNAPIFEGLGAGFEEHVGPIGARLDTLVDTVSANFDRLAGIGEGIADRLRGAFSGLSLEGLGDLGGGAIETAIAAYTKFQEVAGGVLDALAGFGEFAGTALVDYFRGYFDGLAPYMDDLGAKLSAIGEQIGPTLDHLATIGSAIGDAFSKIAGNEAAMGSIQAFGTFMGKFAGTVANISLTGLEGLARWIETVTGAMAALYSGDMAGVRAEFAEFFDWLGGLSFPDLMPDIDIGATLSTAIAAGKDRVLAAFAGLFDFEWKSMLPEWDWSAIIPKKPDWLSNLFGGTAEEQAGPVIPEPPAPPPMPSIDTVRAASGEVKALNDNIAAATGAANALPGAISTALGDARAQAGAFDLTAEGARIAATLAGGLAAGGAQAASAMRGTIAAIGAAASLNLYARGASMMDTLAAGMRARGQAAVAEMAKIAQALRDHLPSSPAKTGPLSDIHRLKFGETIARSIHGEPVIRAMRALSADAMKAGLPQSRRFGFVAGPARRAAMAPTPRSRPDIFRGEARQTPQGGAALGPAAITVNAPLTITNPQFATTSDKAEFEALLRRHSRAVAEAVDNETRRRDRLRF